MNRVDLCCCICKKQTGNTIESHAFRFTITRMDLDISAPYLDTDHREFILCTDPMCRLALIDDFANETKMEIIQNTNTEEVI